MEDLCVIQRNWQLYIYYLDKFNNYSAKNAPSNLLLFLIQRADILVDFSIFDKGTAVYFINVGPDTPYKGPR